MTTTLITDYLKAGTAAARPAAPTPPTGALVVYIATDTGVVSVWNGAAWIQGTYADGGATASPDWTSGAGAPAATKPVGSLYSRVGGAVGATLYVSRGAGVWAAVAGV
jgi:hypothetical protein